ncbi:hypothetical protein [Lysinibacillus parviboronicapiens]|uniref:hypothetical protein n=1 Tax=Lysinibacillus parviboronicapiens TaxID=436516 RepID=UPI001F2B7DF4|nr:hypothetical protein [Lysinibacillus parviboronicapiens]
MDIELKEQILKLEEQLMYARKNDFENILSDYYVEFGSSGMKYDKAFLDENQAYINYCI